MKAKIPNQSRLSSWVEVAAILLTLVVAMSVRAAQVTTIAGGPPDAADYIDGETTVDSRFNGPMGMAFDSAGYLYLADYNNNAVRLLDLANDWTSTFATGSNPVGVAIDQHDNIYVLYSGNGTNGLVVQYDVYGDIVATNISGLPSVGGIAVDFASDVYVTSSNSIILFNSSGITNLITITNANTSLKGITVMGSGLLAVADYGRNGIYNVNPQSGVVVTNTGFNGAGDAFGPKTRTRFQQPFGLLSVGNDCLIVADSGNNRVKFVDSTGTVTNVYGVNSNYWLTSSTRPTAGLEDGTVVYGSAAANFNFPSNVEARVPVGLAMDSSGTLYASEDYYHVVRTVTAAGLPMKPTPPAKVATPTIGVVTFVYDQTLGEYLSVLNPIANGGTTNFYNDAIVVISGPNGAETIYDSTTNYPVADLPDPAGGVVGTFGVPFIYQDGTVGLGSVPTMFLPQSHLTIKAMSTAFGAPNSDVTSAHINFVTYDPSFSGNNAASFTFGDGTTNAIIYYTTDGSDPNPTNSPTSGVSPGFPISLNMVGSNLLVKAQAFRDGYAPSQIVSNLFTSSGYVPNTITLGFSAGEASSTFVASPGQSFYAPITLNLLPGTKMYSLQFNVTVTNAGPNPGPMLVPTPGYLNFVTALQKPDPLNPGFYIPIPPAMYLPEVPTSVVITNTYIVTNYNGNPPIYTNIVIFTNAYYLDYAQNPPPTNQIFYYEGVPFLSLNFVNQNENLIGVGWLERKGEANLYDTTKQDLITYSQAHDVQFLSSAGKVEVGDYSFVVPSSAVPGQTYQIQIGRPSATSDGIGAPGSDVVLASPTNGSLTTGAVNGTKIVTIGQIKYLVGDVAPFRWFNAGDFGDTNLDNSDVMQVFQSAVYSLDYPPTNSDFFDAMDSCGGTYTNKGAGYLEFNNAVTNASGLNPLFYGNDTTINQMAFGDGNLDVCDVYVTFRRSLDPGLNWFERFWTNGVRAAEIVPNVTPNAVTQKSSGMPKPQGTVTGTQPLVNFSAADFQMSPGQTVTVPITAQVFGNFPLRVLALNLSVEALDGSPALTSPIQFTPNASLGAPTLSVTNGNANYAAAWLSSTIGGFLGTTVVGTLSISIPATATSQSAYAIHFDHASASPNGLASFPKTVYTGLITLSSRTNSTYNDGIPDSWRLRWFGTIYNALSVSNADACGDGINNWQKYIAGTDPTDPTAYPHLLPKSSVPSGATSAIHWPTVSGKQYVIERSFSLYEGWTPVSTNTGTGTDMEFDDTAAGGARFYRVQILP